MARRGGVGCIVAGAVLVTLAWRWVSCAGAREQAEARSAYVAENCPDMTSYDACATKVARARAEQQQREQEEKEQQRAAQEAARVAHRLYLRDTQNQDRSLIDEVLKSSAKQIGTLDTVPRCGPQMKGAGIWAAENLDKAHGLGRDLDYELAGDPTPRQSDALSHLRNALQLAETCGPCSDGSKVACSRERAEVEQALKVLARRR